MPFMVLRSAQWAALSPEAVKALLDLLSEYRGGNNGDLGSAWSTMYERGWRSKERLWRALRELETKGWIQRTRQGGRHACNLWACTVFALDESLKLEISAAQFDRGAWARVAPERTESVRRVPKAGAPVGERIDDSISGAFCGPVGERIGPDVPRWANGSGEGSTACAPVGERKTTICDPLVPRWANAFLELPSSLPVLDPRTMEATVLPRPLMTAQEEARKRLLLQQLESLQAAKGPTN